nr:hypothetical protein [Tanacetum cinerariifolium]
MIYDLTYINLILSFAAWVPIGKSNFVLDLHKNQKNPICQISVDILQNTNFFMAFTASASLDETRFVLDANLLRNTLEITPIDQAHQFASPSSGDAIMDFVNQLGYNEIIQFVSRMVEFVQAIQTFLTDKANLGSPTKKGRKDKPHVIMYYHFTKLTIYQLRGIHNIHQRSTSSFHLAEEDLRLGNLKFVPNGKVDEVFGMPIPNELISNNIRNAPYYNAYLEMVAKHDQKVAAEKEGKKKTTSAKTPNMLYAQSRVEDDMLFHRLDDMGSFVDKIIFRAPDSPDQFHCFHCNDVSRAGETCKRCTCAKCGSGLSKGLCYICGHNQNSLNNSPSIFEPSSQSPLNINHCCSECGDPLDGIFYKSCTCKSCGKDAHIGYNCPSTVLVISNPEPCNNQTINELPQTLPIFHLTFQSEAESSFTLDSTPTYVNKSPNVFNPPPQPSVYPCEFYGNDAYYGHYSTPQAPLIYPEPCYNQDFNFPQNFQ